MAIHRQEDDYSVRNTCLYGDINVIIFQTAPGGHAVKENIKTPDVTTRNSEKQTEYAKGYFFFGWVFMN